MIPTSIMPVAAARNKRTLHHHHSHNHSHHDSNGNIFSSDGQKMKGWRSHWSFLNVVLCAALGLLMAMGLLLYLSVLMSPAVFGQILQDAVRCKEANNGISHDHISPNSLLSSHKDRKHETVPDRTGEGEPKFSILVGVLTVPGKTDRRHLLRMAYAKQSSPDANVVVRFVMGSLAENKLDETMVGMENATYGDILVLDIKENLNSGKTFAYFTSLLKLGFKYDYVMKTDDDSYIRFDNLASSLKNLSRTDVYYGYVLPCESNNAYERYMAGMGYLISWDLVEWIGESPIPRNMTVGTEDQLVGDWFNAGKRAKHRVSKKPLFYDHVGFGGGCAHELIPETILVHQIKTPERWADVFEFFEKDRIAQALPKSASGSQVS